MKELEARLRRTDRKQAGLYLLCNFISLMLMTAYSALMFSPTVLNIFPEGGESNPPHFQGGRPSARRHLGLIFS